MNDPFHHLEWVPRDFRELAVDVTHAQFTQIGAATHWRPPINAYRCHDCFTVCVDLAGTESIATKVLIEGNQLIIRGHRTSLEPTCDAPQPVQILAMEIDHGAFERVLMLPEEVDATRASTEHRNGLLWIRIPLQQAAEAQSS
jgi:HSP20 family protein